MQKPKMTTIYAVQMLSVLEYYRRTNKKEGDPILPLKIIQKHSGVKSLHLLEQVARELRIRGIIHSVKGPKGGCQLITDLSTVRIGDLEKDIVEAEKAWPNTKVVKCLTSHFDSCLNLFFNTILTDLEGFGKNSPQKEICEKI